MSSGNKDGARDPEKKRKQKWWKVKGGIEKGRKEGELEQQKKRRHNGMRSD